MTIQELINKAYLLASGKASDLAIDSKKYKRLFDIANIVKKDWHNELIFANKLRWQCLEKNNQLLPDPTNNLSYKLDDDFIDIVPKKHTLRIINNDEIQELTDNDYEINFSEKTLNIIPSRINPKVIGGTLFIKFYKSQPDYTNPSDEVLIPDINWLAYMMAAEYVRNDIVRSSQFGNLISYANNVLNATKTREQSEYLAKHDVMDFLT